MSSTTTYRTNAEECLRIAAAPDQHDKSFWLVLAQSWLRLAEHAAARSGAELKSEGPHVGRRTH
jgi:hypothetical protein